MSDLISIGLPVVKADFLKESLECCLNQSYDNLEIILLNNAGSHKTREEIRAIYQEFNSPKIIYLENEQQLPMIPNWNKTLEKANGEFFSLLCDDDKWDKDFLVRMHELTWKYPETNIFHSRVASINEKGEWLNIAQICPEFEDVYDFIYHRISGFRSMFLSDFMVRTNALRVIGGFYDMPDGWGSDDITWFKIAATGGIAYNSDVLFYYRVSDINISNKKGIGKKLQAIDLQHDAIIELLKDIPANDEFQKTKYQMILDRLKGFVSTKKMFLRKKDLQEKYKLPYSLALGLAYLLTRVNRIL